MATTRLCSASKMLLNSRVSRVAELISMLLTICICTRGRPHLRDTLASVGGQERPDGAAVEILVVDNAPGGPARAIIDDVAATLPIPIRYVAEARAGLSFARNRTIEHARGEWLALIDDDATADPGWLRELYRTAGRHAADAVVGTVIARFETPPSPSVAASRLFEWRLPATGAPVGLGDALTGNAMLRRGFLVDHDLRFDESFNATGGEDSDLFHRFIDLGGRIVSCREAVVREFVPKERMTSEYMTMRALRTGETFARVMQRHGGRKAAVLVGLKSSFNVAAASLLLMACRLTGRSAEHHFRMLLLRNVGKLRYLLGVSPVELYADRPSKVSAA